jgi:apolipoprotein D and lipocalin family protein
MIKFFLLSVFAILCLNHAYTMKMGKCPAVSSKLSSFEIGKYLGHWYEITRSKIVPFQKGECVQATYSLNDDRSVKVFNTELREDGKWASVVGRATTTDIPYKLEVSFSDSWIRKFMKGNYQVIDTDYDSYSLVYSCEDLLLFKMEFTWILSRTPEMPEEKINELINTLSTSFNIPSDHIRFTNQSKELCGY